MDKIEIKNLEIFANHGVFPEENVLGQKFVVSATLYTDTRKAGLTDELTASIHYGEVSQMITKFTKEHTYKLLEALAENLCQMLLQNFLFFKRSLCVLKSHGLRRTSTGYSCCRDHPKLAYRLYCFWFQSGRQKEISG